MNNWQVCDWYGAEFEGIIYAVAAWGEPIARRLNGRGWLELRRMAIAPDAPKNTASRMLKIMRILIIREYPQRCKLISYQDTAVHSGTIYKAAGWKPVECFQSGDNWNNPSRPGVGPLHLKKATLKIRWELDI